MVISVLSVLQLCIQAYIRVDTVIQGAILKYRLVQLCISTGYQLVKYKVNVYDKYTCTFISVTL